MTGPIVLRTFRSVDELIAYLAQVDAEYDRQTRERQDRLLVETYKRVAARMGPPVTDGKKNSGDL